MFWFPLSFPWQTLFTFMSIQIGNRREGTDLIERDYTKGSGSLKGVVSDWKPFTVTWGHMDWELAVNGHQVLVDKGALSKLNLYTHILKMNLGRKVSPSLSVNTLGGKCSSCLKIALCHQCGSPPLISRAKQAKWLRRAWMGGRGHPIKSHYSLFIFVSNMKLNDRTSYNLVFLVLLWAVIIHICKNSFRVQKTDRVVGGKNNSLWETDFPHCSYHF